MTPVVEEKPMQANTVASERSVIPIPPEIQRDVLRPPGVVFRRVCTNYVMEAYDVVPFEGLVLLPDITFIRQKYDVTALLTGKKELWMFGK